MAGMANRLARRARMARPTITAPSSMRTVDDRTVWLSGPEELDDLLDASGCSHHDQVVAGFHLDLRSGRRDCLLTSENGHDGHPSARPHPGVADRSIREGGVFADRKPIDGQSFDLLVQLGQLLGNAGGPEHLRERARILLTQSEHPLETVGVVSIGQIDLTAAGAVRDDSHSLPLPGHELVSHPDPGELDRTDLVHVLTTPVRLIRGRTV